MQGIQVGYVQSSPPKKNPSQKNKKEISQMESVAVGHHNKYFTLTTPLGARYLLAGVRMCANTYIYIQPEVYWYVS